MNAFEEYDIGSVVRSQGERCGHVVCVVVDPVAERLTHLIVVAPDGTAGRLVPVELTHADADGVRLTCTREEFAGLEPSVATHFLMAPDAEQRYGYQEGEVVYWPHYGLAPGEAVAGPDPLSRRIEIEDRVPAGQVRIRRGERVAASDGHIGHVRGLVVDPDGEAVTHVLLDEGHLWGHKRVAIPVGEVSGIDAGGVTVRLTKHQIKDLPSVEVAGLD
jgi:sporulation protein YlmC with PRC-barrel domain